MSKLVTVLVPVVGGAVVAAIGIVALVSAQVSAPSTNPANQAVISYGSR